MQISNVGEGGGYKTGGDNMLGKIVLCCDNRKCGSHTLANLEDLIEMTVENGCLRSA